MRACEAMSDDDGDDEETMGEQADEDGARERAGAEGQLACIERFFFGLSGKKNGKIFWRKFLLR